ncbi:hypothetical protein IFR05_008803 [Cadophora sp. M221]|nr:hypothetical protein IFR05_008803 [Cadophora sp. M221]
MTVHVDQVSESVSDFVPSIIPHQVNNYHSIMARPTPKRGTTDGNPRFQPAQQKSKNVADTNGGTNPPSVSSTSFFPDYSNMGWYNQQSDDGQQHPAYSDPSQRTLSNSQLSLMSPMAFEPSLRTQPSLAQVDSTQYTTAGGSYDAHQKTSGTNGYGEAPGSVDGSDWQPMGSGYSPFHGPAEDSVVRVLKDLKLPPISNSPAPQPVAKDRSQKSLAIQTSSVGAIPSSDIAQAITIPHPVGRNGPTGALFASTSNYNLKEDVGRPFPTFSKGPMVNSSHQRLKLTRGQINRLSKAKLTALKAEKLATFDLFPKLPYELRCMIYDLMLPDRRIIEIKLRKLSEENRDMGSFLLSYDFPAVFYISSEARQWAERKFNYKKAFGNNLDGKAIYYDPHRDSLLFDSIPVCENFFNASLTRSEIQARDRARMTKHFYLKSKAIDAPLFLAINNAWELDVPTDAFKHLGQPQNIVLARPSAVAGRMDRAAAKEIFEGLEHAAKRLLPGQQIVAPNMVCCMTFKELRDRVEELNRPPPPIVPAEEVTGTCDNVNKTASNTSVGDDERHLVAVSNIFDTIIIGAGLSGLQAALFLHNANRSILILEARSRIGGKTNSIERPDGKGIQELGAAWLNDTNQSHVWEYVQKFSLTPVVQNIEGLVAAEDVEGKCHLFPFGELPRFGEDVRRNIEMLRDQIERASLNPETFEKPKCDQLDAISFEQYCKDLGAGPEAFLTARVWSRGTLGQDPCDVSALAYLEICRGGHGLVNLRYDGKDGAQYLRLQEGTQSIALGISRLLPTEAIKLKTAVNSIISSNSKLYTVTTSQGETFHSRKVIVSIPSPAYQNITFEPPLPAQKKRYATSVLYGTFVKFICLFKTPFWKRLGACGLAQSFRGPVNHCRDTSVPDQDNFALTCFLCADPGREWLALGKNERVEVVLKKLGSLFGVGYDVVKAEFIDSITSEWTEDPWAGWGCPFATRPPGLEVDVDMAVKKHDGLYFVGTEFAAGWRGYMEGALRSGKEGARQVLGDFKEEENRNPMIR